MMVLSCGAETPTPKNWLCVKGHKIAVDFDDFEKVSGEFDREEGIRQACNVFGYDREDFEDNDEYEDDSEPLSDDICETDYDGDGI